LCSENYPVLAVSSFAALREPNSFVVVRLPLTVGIRIDEPFFNPACAFELVNSLQVRESDCGHERRRRDGMSQIIINGLELKPTEFNRDWSSRRRLVAE
jgi:hypothetical protein